MKTIVIISFFVIAFVQSVTIMPLQQSDLDRFKQIAGNDKIYSKICDLYYAIYLSEEMKVMSPKMTCGSIPVDYSSVEDSFYSYSVLQHYKCKTTIPNNLESVINDVSSLEEVRYAILFPEVTYDADALATKVFNLLDNCSLLSCTDLSLSQKTAAISILSKLYSSVNAATRTAIKKYITICKDLVVSTVSNGVAINEELSFFSIADLVMEATSHNSLSIYDTSECAKYFLSYRYTSRSSYAFTIIRVLSIIRPIIGDYLAFVSGSYKNGRIDLSVVNISNKPISEMEVSVSLKNGDKLITRYLNGVYVINTELKSGLNVLSVMVQTREGEQMFDDDVNIINPIEIAVSSFSLTIGKNTQAYTIPVKREITEIIDSSVNVQFSVKIKSISDISDLVGFLLLENENGIKMTLPMSLKDNSMDINFTPSRKDIASTFFYQAGVIKFSILCGGFDLAFPMSIKLIDAKVDFGLEPGNPIFPLYSKPLLYASESSIKPLKEIEHVFKPENRNPFFLFPLTFSCAIVASFVVLVATFVHMGFVFQKESYSKFISRFVFLICVALITVLYFIFWYGWNMISLLKVLVPLAMVTVIVGNRAL